jgi:hypothetical protein
MAVKQVETTSKTSSATGAVIKSHDLIVYEKKTFHENQKENSPKCPV